MNPFDLMKNLQQAQAQMAGMQEKIKTIRETGQAGGDMVSVAMDGLFKIVSIKISPSIIDPQDPEFLQDLIVAASFDAHNKVQTRIQNEFGALGGSNAMMGQLGKLFGG